MVPRDRLERFFPDAVPNCLCADMAYGATSNDDRE